MHGVHVVQDAISVMLKFRVGIVGQLEVHKLFAEPQYSGAGGDRGGMMRLSSQSSTRLATADATHEATLENEVLHVRVVVVAGQIDVLQNGVRVQGKCENRAHSAPMSV